MDVVCAREKLCYAVNIAYRAVPVRTTLPILECILIIAEENYVKLFTNNLEMAIETSCIDASVKSSGRVAVNAKMFAEIIKNFSDEEVALKVQNNILVIKNGRSKFRISSQTGDDFPMLPVIDKAFKYEVSAITLKNMIKQTIFSVSFDESKPMLMGELIEVKNKKLNMIALDGFRIAFRTESIDKDCEDNSIIIPSKTLNEVARILPPDGNVIFYFTDSSALFELKSCKVVTRLIEGKFINYEVMFSCECNTHVKINRQELLKSLERAALIATSDKKTPVKLEIKKNLVIVTSSTELNVSYEEIYADVEGIFLSIAFNPKYLIDVVKSITDDSIIMQFSGEFNPCIIRSAESYNDKYLILPLRLK
jgi:DNA polymerase-3 subunit beta